MRSCTRHAIVAAGALLCALGEVLSGCGARAVEEESIERQSSDQAAAAPPTLVKEAAWRTKMLAIPPPKPEGCFHASHPNTVWEEIPCGSDPGLPYPPAQGAAPQNVGSGTDYAGTVADNISQAVSSFVSVTGVTSETGTTFGSSNCSNPVAGVANIYSLQLNTNRFSTAANGCGIAGCQGWQQFVYSSNQSQVFMQYWMLNHGACPASWNTSGNSCWKNSVMTNVPSQPIKNLVKLSVTATAKSGGNDQVTLSTGDGNLYTSTGSDSVLGLASAWNGQEFNVVGDGCLSQANFNNGSTIVVQTALTHSNTGAPFCTPKNFSGWTGETNNLNLIAGACCPSGGTSPAFRFTETNAAGVKAPFCLLNDVSSITGVF